jgi:type 1 fimbria pilin
MKKFLLAALAFTVFASAAPLAHPGHEHKLMGTITAINGNKVSIKTTEGKDVTFQVVPTTDFKRGKQKGAQSELKVGLRVVVTVGDGKEPFKAKDVEYAEPTTTTKQ